MLSKRFFIYTNKFFLFSNWPIFITTNGLFDTNGLFLSYKWQYFIITNGLFDAKDSFSLLLTDSSSVVIYTTPMASHSSYIFNPSTDPLRPKVNINRLHGVT